MAVLSPLKLKLSPGIWGSGNLNRRFVTAGRILVNQWTAGVGKSENFGGFIKSFARGIIGRFSDHLHPGGRFTNYNLCMTATDG